MTRPRCTDEAALDRVAYVQGDYTSDSSHRCSLCAHAAAPLWPLILSDQGWVCASGERCRQLSEGEQ